MNEIIEEITTVLKLVIVDESGLAFLREVCELNSSLITSDSTLQILDTLIHKESNGDYNNLGYISRIYAALSSVEVDGMVLTSRINDYMSAYRESVIMITKDNKNIFTCDINEVNTLMDILAIINLFSVTIMEKLKQ